MKLNEFYKDKELDENKPGPSISAYFAVAVSCS